VPCNQSTYGNRRTSVRRGPLISIGIGEWVLGEPGNRGIHRVSEVMTETRTLSLVPILGPHQIELGGPTDEDREAQGRRCSSRALTN
jgi:hypothetical protein